MREVVFKGKRTDNGEWVEGFIFDDGLIDSEKMFIGSIVIENNEITGRCFCEVNPATVGQYTGLKDKNGKRIFEGDIVKAQDDLTLSPFCYGLVGKVVYIETAFFIEPKDPTKSEYLFNECAVYEVLGNIHDNGVEELNGD